MDNTQNPSADSSGVSRNQNQLHIVPEDFNAATEILAPLLDRLDPAVAATQLLVIAGDADAAAGLSGRLVRLADERGLRVLTATDSRRGARLLKTGAAHLVFATPGAAVELSKAASLKLGDVKVVALAWVDDLGAGATRALETIIAETPKDSARIVLAAHETLAVEQLVERYARRARKVQAVGVEPLPPVSLAYVSTTDAGRLDALRRVLDVLDPDSAVIVSRSASVRDDVSALLRSLGYEQGGAVRAAESADPTARAIVFLDFPASEGELRRAHASRIIALVAPRQIASLKRLAGGNVSPFALPEAAARARTREDGLRDELRAILATGQYGRELIALESLLADYDGAEVAAAALRLLEAERVKAVSPQPAAAPPAMTKLFINVGETDNVRPQDLVGAIVNEANVARSDVGRVEVRDRFSTVEVSSAVANDVVTKLTGVAIRGRRAMVKVDEGADRPKRPRPDRGDRGDRPGRSGPGRPRPARPSRPRSRDT